MNNTQQSRTIEKICTNIQPETPENVSVATKKESGRGTKKLFDQKGENRPYYRCMDKLNNDTDDEDHDENDV
jgi:hypothetical protein